MADIPSLAAPDSTLALLADPYRFISRNCRETGADLFEARLLLQKTICMTGPEAAECFYDQARFARKGAMPGAVMKTLLGVGGVQGLDGNHHVHRKGMFMQLMSDARIRDLLQTTASMWKTQAQQWAYSGSVTLYDAVQVLLTRAVCSWAGVPLEESDVHRRSRQLTALFDQAVAKGPGHLRSRIERKLANRWAATIVEDVRAGRIRPLTEQAASVIALHEAPDGSRLDPSIAAVELLNILRPVVAVAVYMVFVAHAFEKHPECRERVRAGDDRYAERFVQEVRRFYPFFPAVAARVRADFDWRGYRFEKGRRVLLDLYGTDRDARTWDDPDAFRPDRFEGWDGSPYNFIPQGGGDHAHNHRCAGEWITIALMKQAAEVLAGPLRYSVPPQDLEIDYGRMPALPRSRFVMKDVHWHPADA